ncbi:VCBS repeat-containing protein [Candidatus Fermentibacterales bacterium]|nr:VCBS repeat-containing protein [Candidatus Fermentibacterales bacterium]
MTRLTNPLACLALLALQVQAQDFTRITEGPLVNDDRYSEGSSWGDINNDCLLDVFVPDAYAERSNLLFLNNGDGSFTQVTEGPVVTDISRSSGCSFGDFDNDGDLDLFVQNWEGMNSHLYLNNGDGSFTKVTSGQIVSDGGWSFNSSVVDYDNDRNLDIYVDNGAFTSFGENNSLYHGNGDGTFTKVTEGDPVNDREHCLSSSWCDFDYDGDQDLFTANSDPFNGVAIANFLYLNNGDGTFTKLTEGIVVTDVRISTGGSWGDYDNDGDFDLFVANWYGEDNQLYRNEGDGSFSRVTSGSVVSDGGNSVSGAWGDYDNDGHLDLYVTNDWNEDNFLYLNDGDGSFTRITTGDIVSNGGRSNGATWADYNNDGFLDMFVPNGQAPPQSNFLYMNNGLSGNSWVNIRLVGTASNASGIGARLTAAAILVDTLVSQHREVSGHQGFNAQESFNVEFGLGAAETLDSLVIEWPSGIVDFYTGLDVEEFYLAVENEGISVVTSVYGDQGDPPSAGSCAVRAFPNPFSCSVTLWAEPGSPATASLGVYDLSGRLVEVLFDGEAMAGALSCQLDGSRLPAGVYLARLQAGDQSATARLLKL